MAKIKLTWADTANTDHTGYRVRMSADFSLTPIANFVLQATLPAAAREHLAGGDALSGIRYWAVSAFNEDQDVLAAKIAMSFKGLIVPVDALYGVKDGLEASRMSSDVDKKIPQCIPTTGVGGSWTGPKSGAVLVQVSDADVFFADADGLKKVVFDASGNPASCSLEVAVPYDSATAPLWAIWVPGTTKIIAMHVTKGMAVYDYSAKTVTKEHEKTSYNAIRAALLPDGKHIVMVGSNSSASNTLLFEVLNTEDMTIVACPTTVTNANTWYGGVLVVGIDKVCWWPSGGTSVKAVSVTIADLLGGVGASAVQSTVSVAYPNGGMSSWFPAPNSNNWMTYTNGNTILIDLSTDPVAIMQVAGADMFGQAITGFSTTIVSGCTLPDGAVWMVGTAAGQGLYWTYQGDTKVEVVTGVAGGYWYTFMHKGALFSVSTSDYWRPGFKVDPVLSMPQAWWRSQYNFQGRNPNT